MTESTDEHSDKKGSDQNSEEDQFMGELTAADVRRANLAKIAAVQISTALQERDAQREKIIRAYKAGATGIVVVLGLIGLNVYTVVADIIDKNKKAIESSQAIADSLKNYQIEATRLLNRLANADEQIERVVKIADLTSDNIAFELRKQFENSSAQIDAHIMKSAARTNSALAISDSMTTSIQNRHEELTDKSEKLRRSIYSMIDTASTFRDDFADDLQKIDDLELSTVANQIQNKVVLYSGEPLDVVLPGQIRPVALTYVVFAAGRRNRIGEEIHIGSAAPQALSSKSTLDPTPIRGTGYAFMVVLTQPKHDPPYLVGEFIKWPSN